MFVPCADGASSHVNENGTASIHMELGDHHGSCADACAPFCSCQCCQTQLSGFDALDFAVLAPHFYPIQITYKDNLKQEFSTTFFQPPIV